MCSAMTDQSVGDVQVQILPDDVLGHAGGTSDAVLVEERMLQEVRRSVAGRCAVQ